MTTDNHLESKSLIKHIKFQIHKDKICNLAKTHKKNIAYFLAVVVVAIIILVGNSSYQQFQAKKYSTILHQAMIDEQNGEIEKSTAALKKIYESNAPAGVKQIASLTYLSRLMTEGKSSEAIDGYLAINQNTKFDKYVREYAGLNALKISIDHIKIEDKDRLLALANKLEKGSKILKNYITEQKGLLLWSVGDLKAANDIFESLANNLEASDLLKKRAAEMVDIYKSKFPDAKIDEPKKKS